ncbi:hypothetical protein MM213_04755 [Belliella sp. R4-6]|uniref:Small multi-drug export protein n=1 Tax=Belliella alkalica TaxID=1730871 RepID=A0ABS9V9L1_9BACT|nr:hypothetical protein [Belliella alkalica]MCH7412785.1 hypothetical protein [Belliella alkalica]
MISYILKFSAIYFTCLFKFVAGPILGAAAGYSIFEITLVTVSGMMTTVFFITYLGDWVKANWKIKARKKKNIFSKKNRRIVKIWQKFGPIGIATITPILLTPIGGTIIMIAFRVEKRKVFTYMFISALSWALVLAASIQQILSIPIVDKLLS